MSTNKFPFTPAPIVLPEHEVSITAVRAQGAGGQNVNKVSSAIHLRFDIAASSLPEAIKARLLALRDNRVTQAGVFILKAQQHRTQELNRVDAFARLHAWVSSVALPPRLRRASKPTAASIVRRQVAKIRRADVKAARSKVRDID